MNSSDPSGTDDFEGVNPASGATIYYHLPTLTEDEKITLTIYDSEGQVIRSFSSTEDLNYVSYDGYPSAEPTLSKKEGLNRFVWDLRHPNLEGVPEVYIEASFRGHKVSPGQYQIELKFKDQVVRQPIEVVASPLSKTTKEEWMIYDTFMKSAEANYNEMTRQTNRLHSLSKQLEKLIRSGLTDSLIGQAKALQNELKQWDAKMVQRLSKAYDDVENYENGFTANYIRAFNEADSSEPRVTEGTKRVIEEHNKQWSLLRAEGNRLEYEAIPSLNKLLFEAGVGALNNK
jgi:polyhydroxyalkanoate synthesis regulator phasin